MTLDLEGQIKLASDMEERIRKRQEELAKPVKRLVIIQETGLQCGIPRYESHIQEFVPFNDQEFGKQYCAELNRKTDLPFYLAEVEVRICSEMEEWTDEKLKEAGIEPLGE